MNFILDPCARVNCNHGRCEPDRGIAVCRCYQGYSGSDCLTVLGRFAWRIFGVADAFVVERNPLELCSWIRSFSFLSMQMHVLECHATTAHASMKSHRIDVNVNEAMKVRHAIEHQIRAQVSFATTEVSVIFNKISNQRANVSLVIEERIATIKMVCADDSVRCLLVRMSCMLFFLAFFFSCSNGCSRRLRQS